MFNPELTLASASSSIGTLKGYTQWNFVPSRLLGSAAEIADMCRAILLQDAPAAIEQARYALVEDAAHGWYAENVCVYPLLANDRTTRHVALEMFLNALEHGVSYRGRVSALLLEGEKGTVFSVDDAGKGFDVSAMPRTSTFLYEDDACNREDGIRGYGLHTAVNSPEIALGYERLAHGFRAIILRLFDDSIARKMA